MAYSDKRNDRCKVGAFYGQAGYVVPCDLLAPILDAHKAELENDDRHPHDGQASGWRQALADRVAANTGRTPEAVFRRLYDVMHGKSKALNIDLAEGMLIAVGLLLDHDTDLPTLPGCITAARDMADVHADMFDEGMTLAERERLAHSILHFSQGFVHFDAYEQACEVVCEFIFRVGNAPTREEELVAA